MKKQVVLHCTALRPYSPARTYKRVNSVARGNWALGKKRATVPRVGWSHTFEGGRCPYCGTAEPRRPAVQS